MALSGNPRAMLAARLATILRAYETRHRSFGAWESHCLGMAIVLLQVGDFSGALQSLDDVDLTVAASSTFPLPRPLTTDDLRHAIATLTNQAPPAS